MKKNKWLEKNCASLKNKRVVITGATGGLGEVICFMLAELDADITLACRNENKANALKSKLLTSYPNTKIDFVHLDFNSLESVNNCINKLKLYNGIDILINNAGIYNVPLEKMDSGYNNVFQTNFVYPYYFTKKLLPELEKCENSTCVVLGSVAHNYSKLDEKDIDFSTRKKSSKIYGNSKRFLMFSFFELFKDSKVNLSVVHPGVTLTNMTNHYPKYINWLVKIGIKLVFPSPKKATRSILYGTCHTPPTYNWIGPKIFNVWGNPHISRLKTCSAEESKKIYSIAEEIYNKL